MAEQGAMNFLPSEPLTEEEQMERVEQQTKGNTMYHIIWCFLALTIIMMSEDKAWNTNIQMLLVIRMVMRIVYSIPTRWFSYYLAVRKRISPATVNILTAVFALPVYIWYFYIVILFFGSSNDWRKNNYVLWMGFVLLLIESVIYIVFWVLISILLCIIGILMGIYFFAKIKEKRNNGKIKEMFLKCKGLVLGYSETQGDTEWCIWFNEFDENSDIMRMPCNSLHYFHKDWISEWVGRKSNWPICKTQVTADSLKPYKKKPKKSKSKTPNGETELMARNNINSAN